MTTTGGRPGSSSAGSSIRPRAGDTPSSVPSSPEALIPVSRTGGPWPVRFTPQVARPTRASSRVARLRTSSKLGSEKKARSRSVRVDQIHTSRAGSWKGRARSSTPSMLVARTAFAPMHRASVMTTPAENAGARAMRRSAERTSRPRRDIGTSPVSGPERRASAGPGATAGADSVQPGGGVPIPGRPFPVRTPGVGHRPASRGRAARRTGRRRWCETACPRRPSVSARGTRFGVQKRSPGSAGPPHELEAGRLARQRARGGLPFLHVEHASACRTGTRLEDLS